MRVIYIGMSSQNRQLGQKLIGETQNFEEEKEMKKALALLLVVVLVASLAACGGGGGGGNDSDTTTLVFGNVSLDAGIAGGDLFAEVAYRESGGTLIIEMHHNNSLGDDRTQVESTVFGDVDIVASSTSPIAQMYADFFVFDAPFLFFDRTEADYITQGPIGREILDGMESIGLKGLGFMENGFRHFTGSHPVYTPADVAGVTIRTMENAMHMAAWRAFGANPTPMAMTEVFTALQQGTIDAQENTMGSIDGFALFEIQPHISMTGHIYTPFFIAMNLDAWNALSPEHQNAITVATQAMIELNNQMTIELYDVFIETWQTENGVTFHWPSDAQKQQFADLAEADGVLDTIRGEMDHPEFVDRILAALGR